MLACSFHGQFIDPESGEDLYFPGQGRGRAEYLGEGRGLGYTVNVPLGPGQTDESFEAIFVPVVDKAGGLTAPRALARPIHLKTCGCLGTSGCP